MKLKLLPKMLLGILLPTIIALGIISFVSVRTASNGMYQQVFDMLEGAVSLQKGELENMVSIFSNGVVKTFSEVARTKRYLTEEAKNIAPDELAKLQVLVQDSALEVATNYTRISSAAIVNSKGLIIAHSDPTQIGKSIANTNYFNQTMQNQVVMENMVASGKVTTVITRPILVNNKPLGVAYINLDLKILAKETTDFLRMGNTGRACVIDEHGIMLMHNNPKLIGSDESYDPFIQQVMLQKNGVTEYFKDNTERFAAFLYIPNIKWIVMVLMDKNEAIAPARNVIQNNLIVVCIVSIIVGLIIFFMARSYTTILARGAKFVQIVADNNFTVSPEMQIILVKDCNMGDELGDLACGVRTLVQAVRSAMDRQEEQTQLAIQATTQAKQAMSEAEKAQAAAEVAKHEGILAAAQQLESIVHIISSASEQVQTQVIHSDKIAQLAAGRLTETSMAMNEMNHTVTEVAKNASVASNVSNQTKKNATEGAHIVQAVLDSIQEVERNSIVLRNDMDSLDKQSLAISHIMNVISDIADQTNLLALNAAIEAARAGDAGRGFAVVADEVRKLAEKTMNSTIDVGSAIRSIQASTHESKEQVQATVHTIEKATSLAKKSGESLRTIVTMVEQTEDQVRAIATASEEQSATSEQINRSLSEVNSIASQTSSSMKEASKAVNELSHQAQALSNLILKLKKS